MCRTSSDEDVSVEIRNDLRIRQVICSNCAWKCVHLCNNSSLNSVNANVMIHRVSHNFRRRYRCTECTFTTEHRDCDQFIYRHNIVVEMKCQRCVFTYSHSCSSDYHDHRDFSEQCSKPDGDSHWSMNVTCGNSMSRFGHICNVIKNRKFWDEAAQLASPHTVQRRYSDSISPNNNNSNRKRHNHLPFCGRRTSKAVHHVRPCANLPPRERGYNSAESTNHNAVTYSRLPRKSFRGRDKISTRNRPKDTRSMQQKISACPCQHHSTPYRTSPSPSWFR